MNKKDISVGIMIVLSLSLIIAISYALYFRSMYLEGEKRKAIYQKTNKITKKHPGTKEYSTTALKNRIKELEYQLQTKIMPIENESQNTHYQNANVHNKSLEEIKESDPERYREIIDYYRRVNGNISEAVQDKLVYFSELDTNWMSKEEKQDHQKLLERLAKLDELSQNNLDKDGTELQEIVQEQKKMMNKLYRGLRKQKDYLFFDIGREMGFSESEANELKNKIKYIEDLTSYRSFYRRKKKR